MPTNTPLPPAESVQRVLVIKSRNIGDVLLTGPLISTLRALYPNAEIDALVKAGTEEMLLDHPHLNRVHTYPRQYEEESNLGFRLRDLHWQWGLRRHGYDLVINNPGVYTINWVAPGSAPNVRIYTSTASPAFTEAQTTYRGATITVTPAPASLALVGLGGLVAGRRRR